MDKYTQAANLIYKEQKKVVGAKLSNYIVRSIGDLVMENDTIVDIKSEDKAKTLDKLIRYYSQIFGQTSIEVSKDAIHEMKDEFAPNELAKSLRK